MDLRWNRLHPDLSTEPRIPTSRIETLIELDLPPGNVATGPDGRIFFGLHPFAQPKRFTDATVFELVDGQAVPYPSQQHQADFNGVLGMTVDGQGRLWMVEPQGLERHPSRLLAFDLASNTMCFDMTMNRKQVCFPQDLRVSPDGKTVYVADTGLFTFVAPRLIVVDVDRASPRTALRRHESIRPQRIAIQALGRRYSIGFGAVTFRVGVDGIALSPDGEWLYYATMNHDGLYRIPRAALDQPDATEADLVGLIERVADKPLNDGIDIDGDGTVFLTDVEHGAISAVTTAGTVETVARDHHIVWPDGVVVGHDGSLLLTDSAIPAYIDQLGRPPARKRIDDAGPFRILRIPGAATPRPT